MVPARRGLALSQWVRNGEDRYLRPRHSIRRVNRVVAQACWARSAKEVPALNTAPNAGLNRATSRNPGLPRIVVGVGGSAGSFAALRWALREAGLRRARLQIVRAWEDRAKRVAPYAPGASQGNAQEEDRRAEVARLEEAARSAVSPAPPVPVAVQTSEGLAARVLLDHAAGAELLVLGSASNSTPGGIGPVARACLRNAPCPVVVVNAAMTGLPATA